MMKRLWQLIIKGKGDNDVYDAASACNTLTSDIIDIPTTIGMINIVRSKGKFNCKSIAGLKNMAQRKYFYDEEGNFTHATLHPQSFLPEASCMTQANLIEYVPESTKTVWPMNVSPPLSIILVADPRQTVEVSSHM